MEDSDPLEIKILVATDIHLGYAEKDNVRKRDSIDSFEEVLQIAEKNKVDMVLLGGDLFHENKPSRSVLWSCTELLRKYCMNDRPVTLEFLSDASVNFKHSKFAHVNYLDPNLNIGLPVFSINGNHDDLSGNGLSALDQLHASGLINYFGKYQNLSRLEVSPILLRKSDGMGGETKLALYGIGSIRDERLNQLFQKEMVAFLTFDDKEEQKTWNNILVLHQNRVRHGPTNYIPETVLPEFLDLVIWGHEHPCRIKPEESSVGFKIMQPGSTVATSLAEGEAGQKCVSLLRIKGKSITDEVIPLKTIRPFYFENIVLAELDIKPGLVDTARKVEKFCDGRVEHYLRLAKAEHPSNPRSSKPLIRLRIDYSDGFEAFNAHRFGSKYIDRVANYREIPLFHRKREQRDATAVDMTVLSKVMKQNAQELRSRVEDLVKEYFKNAKDKSQKLLLLTENAVGTAVREFVNKDEKDAIEEVVKVQLNMMQKKVEEQAANKDNRESIYAFLEGIRDLRIRIDNPDEEETTGIQAALEASRRRRQLEEMNGSHAGSDTHDGETAEDDQMDLGEIDHEAEATPTRGRGSRSRGSSSRGRGSRGRGRGTAVEDDFISPDATPTRARGRPRGSTGRGRGRGRGAVKRPLDDDEDDDIAASGSRASASTAGRGSKSTSKRAAPSRDEVVLIDDDSDF